MPWSVLLYALFPATAVIVGSLVAAYRMPGPGIRSAIQHFAAGVVFAAVSVELLPDVKHEKAALPVIIGFSLGVIAMLVIRRLTEPPQVEGKTLERKPTAMLVTVGLDIAIDGLLVGIGFTVGGQQGILLTFALTLEILFLGLSVAAEFGQAGFNRFAVMRIAIALAVVFAFSAMIGAAVFSALSPTLFTIVVSFGLAALLYLVTEELLIEAHETPDTLLSTTTFFVGFLVLLVISIVTEA